MTTPSPPGWYDDPQDSHAQRYWDGQAWTPHRQRKPDPPDVRPPVVPQQQPTPPPESRNVPPPPGFSPSGPRQGSDGPATIKDFAARTSVTGWVVLVGLVVTVIATFLPFATESIKLFGETLGSREVPADGAAKLVVVVLVALAGWLAFPALSGSQVVVGRLIALSVVVGVLAALTLVWFNKVSAENNQGEGVVELNPGFGLIVYGVAVLVTAAGVVRLWVERSKTRRRPY